MGKLMLNDISYSGGGGGGGSSVTPNPQGTPTDTLNTIEIDSTIYDIAGSGGGGGSKIVDTLWEGTITAPTTGTEVALNHKVSDYDVIAITLATSYATYKEIAIFQTDSMVIGQDYMLTGYHYVNSVALIAFINYTSDTTITVKSTASATPTIYHKIQGIKFCGTLAPQIFSTEEKEIGVWIDNKPLYQKTFDLTSQALTDNAWNNGILGTTGISIKSYKGYFNLGAESLFPYEYYRNNSEFFTVVTGADSADINIRPNMNAGTSVYAGIVTIWYTKDSDVAGSGSYGSLGIPMEHYDNTEKVVGTWLGDTLYEKTFNVTGLSCTTSDYFGSYSGSLDLSGYIGSYDEVFVDLDMSYLTTSGGVKERFVLVQAPPNSTSIYLFTCASRSNVSAVLTVKYTKATT